MIIGCKAADVYENLHKLNLINSMLFTSFHFIGFKSEYHKNVKDMTHHYILKINDGVNSNEILSISDFSKKVKDKFEEYQPPAFFKGKQIWLGDYVEYYRHWGTDIEHITGVVKEVVYKNNVLFTVVEPNSIGTSLQLNLRTVTIDSKITEHIKKHRLGYHIKTRKLV